MAKRTLLAVVQSMLSATDSDEVNTIADTMEAQQAADIVRTVFEEMVEEHDLPSTGQLFTLEDDDTTTYPTRLKIPDNVSSMEWIKYAAVTYPVVEDDPIIKEYKDLIYKSPQDFSRLLDLRNPADTNVQVVSYPLDDEIKLTVRTDKFPQFWTSFDDEHIWFDSWDSTNESTVIANHSKAFGKIAPTFAVEDDYIPDLPGNLFPYFEARCLARFIAHFKQEVNPKVEQAESRMRIRSQRNKWRQSRMLHQGPDFGKEPTAALRNRPIL